MREEARRRQEGRTQEGRAHVSGVGSPHTGETMMVRLTVSVGPLRQGLRQGLRWRRLHRLRE